MAIISTSCPVIDCHIQQYCLCFKAITLTGHHILRPVSSDLTLYLSVYSIYLVSALIGNWNVPTVLLLVIIFYVLCALIVHCIYLSIASSLIGNWILPTVLLLVIIF